jgi:hypothetical protein
MEETDDVDPATLEAWWFGLPALGNPYRWFRGSGFSATLLIQVRLNNKGSS